MVNENVACPLKCENYQQNAIRNRYPYKKVYGFNQLRTNGGKFDLKSSPEHSGWNT